MTSSLGPRGATGPDVPLSRAEGKLLTGVVPVTGSSAAAVQAACDQAVAQKANVVLLPAGTYLFESTVNVPPGLTILGSGAGTVCQTQDITTRLFNVMGDHVHFTRLKLQGAEIVWSETNETTGIYADGKQNLHIDHCEILGFCRATWFDNAATAQVDHCFIHHNLRAGYGYGVCVMSGSYVLVTDNEFSQNRHCLASNAALEWSKDKTWIVHSPGQRKTHWEYCYNRVNGNDLAQVNLAQVETHPGMDGTFVIANSIFQNVRFGVDIADGSGIIRGNLFRDLWSYEPGGIRIEADPIGTPVEYAMPHDIQMSGNTLIGVGTLYRVLAGRNISIDGKLVPETAPPVLPKLKPMGTDGLLAWS